MRTMTADPTTRPGSAALKTLAGATSRLPKLTSGAAVIARLR
jgi:hypothetical protein